MYEIQVNFSLQEAINSLPAGDELCVIKLAPGFYNEVITLTRSNTIIEGTGSSPADTAIVYGNFARDIMPDGIKRGTFRSYTFLLDASNVTLRNLTISNDSGDENVKGQAIALYADGDNLIIENCRLLGRQDTLFTGPLPPKEIEPGGFIGPKQFAPRINGHHHYKQCYICGNVDFIFGSATAYFSDCTIESLLHDSNTTVQGYVTAPSTPEGQEYGYVFNNSKFISSECSTGSVYLGRPWRDYAKSIFINCHLGSHIHQDGFHDWGKEKAHLSSFFCTHNCTVADGNPFTALACFAKAITDEYADSLTPQAVLQQNPE